MLHVRNATRTRSQKAIFRTQSQSNSWNQDGFYFIAFQNSILEVREFMLWIMTDGRTALAAGRLLIKFYFHLLSSGPFLPSHVEKEES